MPDLTPTRRAFGKEGARSLLIEALRNPKPRPPEPVEDIPAFLPAANGAPVSQNGQPHSQVAQKPEIAPAATPEATERSADKVSIKVPDRQIPTADEVARAIVAAARETGENPIDCARGNEGLRCRHYAMHALKHCFPGHPEVTYARLAGAAGSKPAYFYRNSKSSVIRVDHTGRRRSRWWSDEAYDRVIRAIRP